MTHTREGKRFGPSLKVGPWIVLAVVVSILGAALWPGGVFVSFGILTLLLPHYWRYVEVDDKACRYVRMGRTHTIKWQDVAEVYFEACSHYAYGAVYTGDTALLVITSPSSRSIVINHHVREIEQLANIVYCYTTPLVVRRARAALARGAYEAFGLIHTTPNGVSYRKCSIPWRALRNICVSDGRLLMSGGEGCSIDVAVGEVANLPALEVVINTMQSAAQQKLD